MSTRSISRSVSRSVSREASSRHSSRHSSGSESDANPEEEEERASEHDMEADGMEMDAMESDGMESDDMEDNDEHDEMDRTMAINLGSSVAQQLGSVPSSRPRRQMSPGRTPARKMLGRGNFTPGFATEFSRAVEQNTPRLSTFTNTSLPPSLFADVQHTPILTYNSPRKFNSVQRPAPGTPVSISAVMKAKEDELRQLKELAIAGHDEVLIEEFVDFSPDKRRIAPESRQASARKRLSPQKNFVVQSTGSPASALMARSFVPSPIKPTGLFDGMTKPITAEERKKARRRRVTQEFKDFSALDLDSLKSGGFVPKAGTIPEELETMETEHDVPASAEQDQTEATEEVRCNSPVPSVKMEDQEEHNEEEAEERAVEIQAAEVEAAKVEAEAENEPEAIQVEEKESAFVTERRSSIVVPPLNLTRPYRSFSAPPVPRPQDEVTDPALQKFTTSMDLDSEHDTEIARLNARIAELEDKLEIADVQIDRLRAEIIGERRLRIHAQQAQEFLEMERKFGVCCEHNPGSKKPTEKLGPAAIQLPNSSPPPQPVQEEPPRPIAAPKSRLNRTVGGRVGDSRAASARPASRLAEPRPTSRLAENLHSARAGTTSTYAKATAASQATKKRVREEPAPPPPRKPPIPTRPERRALGGSAAANIPAGSQQQQTSALTKKPEKAVGGRNLRGAAGGTGATGGTGRPGALSRGAKR
jgi:hypothetical protein